MGDDPMAGAGLHPLDEQVEDPRLAMVLEDLREVLVQPPSEDVARAHLARITGVEARLLLNEGPDGRDATVIDLADRQPSRSRRLVVAGVASAALLLGAGGVAAAQGALPDPVQDFVHDVVSHVGVDVPTGGQSSDAPGRGGDGPGASEDAPGQTGGGPGSSENAPGLGGTAPGQSSDAPGQGGAGPGSSGNAPGQGGQNPSTTAPGQSGDKQNPSATAPGQVNNPSATAPGQVDNPSATAPGQQKGNPSATAPGQQKGNPSATAPGQVKGQSSGR